jgi:hypothetical protein
MANEEHLAQPQQERNAWFIKFNKWRWARRGRGPDLSREDLCLMGHSQKMDLSRANLSGANLYGANLARADLSRANLSGANLSGALLLRTNFESAHLTGCFIYGISAWDVKLEGATQLNLVITRAHEPRITVDNLEVAQFIYLLLHNEKIREVIDTIGQKGVLILQ